MRTSLKLKRESSLVTLGPRLPRFYAQRPVHVRYIKSLIMQPGGGTGFCLRVGGSDPIGAEPGLTQTDSQGQLGLIFSGVRSECNLTNY